MNTHGERYNETRSNRLATLFLIVALLETAYAALGLLTPPSVVGGITGWDLSPDGQWILKLLGMALAAQAWTAWTLRHTPHRGVAMALAFYQIGSATVDCATWFGIDGAFSTSLARMWVLFAIPTHYLLGVVLLVTIWRTRAEQPMVAA
jgi:hypothetical protein